MSYFNHINTNQVNIHQYTTNYTLQALHAGYDTNMSAHTHTTHCDQQDEQVEEEKCEATLR